MTSAYPFAPAVAAEGVPGRVSAVIVHYRGGGDLLRCLASLERQDWPDIEAVVVDNGSPEGLPPELDVAAATLGDGSVPVRVVRLARNLGFAGGANAGLGAATGAHLFLLNPDTELQPGCVSALVAADADVATARLLLADSPDILDNCGHDLFPDGLNWCRGRGEPADGAYPSSEDVLLFSGAAVLFRRSALVRTGGFDPAYFAYGEDADLSLRAARLGLRCRYVAEAQVHHRVGGSFGRLALRKVLLVERNRARVAVTHLPWTWLLRSPYWTLRRHLTMARSAARDEGIASSWPRWQRPLLPAAVLAAHAASLLDLPGSLRRRRALGGGMSARVLEPARVGLDVLRRRPAGL